MSFGGASARLARQLKAIPARALDGFMIHLCNRVHFASRPWLGAVLSSGAVTIVGEGREKVEEIGLSRGGHGYGRSIEAVVAG